MTQVCKTAFVIEPPDDLLQQYPQLKRAAHELALSYAHCELVTDDRLKAIGSQLWQAINSAEGFQQSLEYAGNKVLPIVVKSADPAIQNLPWEILHHPQHGFLGRETAFTFSRHVPQADTEPEEVNAGPLRVLLFTSLPDDLNPERGRLAVEEEQEAVLEALMPAIASGQVLFEAPNDGRFETLQQQLKTFKPHLVFLSGHGKFIQSAIDDQGSRGCFIFEDDWGFSEAIEEETLASAFHGCAVRGVVLSACESGKAASDALNNGLARRLMAAHLPFVIGMRESVMDRAGILFARAFCDAIALRERVDVALQAARKAIITPIKNSIGKDGDKSELAELSLGQWCLPTLYCAHLEAPLIHWQFEAQPPHQYRLQTKLEGVPLPEKFRGRRRELRKFMGQLRQGKRSQLLFTGPGGQGKTALAGKLALECQQAGWQVVAWSAKEGQHWDDFYLDLRLKLNKENRDWFKDVCEVVKDPEQLSFKLLDALCAQRTEKLLILLDNLESLQNEQSRALQDKTVEAFIRAAQRLADKGVVLLATSRWLLPEWPEDHHWPLDHLSYGDFLQLFVLQGQPTSDYSKLRKIYRVLNGNGRGLQYFSAAAKSMNLEEETQFLQALSQAESDVQTDMALQQLLHQRSDEQRQLLQRMQVFEEPVPIEGVIKLGADLTDPESLLAELVNFSLVEQSHNPHWLANEYHCPELVVKAVNDHLGTPIEDASWLLAAEYLGYLFKNERSNLSMAQSLHRAMMRAKQKELAHRFAMDTIVGRLNNAGLYRTLLEEWLPPICEAENAHIRGEALGQTGKQYLHLGDYETALSYLKQSLAILQEIGDRSGEGTTLNNISQIYDAKGDYEAALSYLKQSLTIRQEIGDVAGLCTVLFNMGHIHLQNEQGSEALNAWLSAYRLAKPIQLAQVLEALARLAEGLGLNEHLGVKGGLSAWEVLLEQQEQRAQAPEPR
ncbi:CHAT domain-containing protein [Teredinibacter turnerae]|uniref:CHAT domain-containing protein n=1 Tax=Teredinibacter turnerae TaxID=2426 RepID=UPI00037FEC6E|nr:CHAT domain-containing protein [Teredinibacter turnerae]